jgi:hypothetical protein
MTIKNFYIAGNTPSYNIGWVSENDVFGGVDLALNLDQQLLSDLQWLRELRAKIAREEEIRRDNPAAAEAYMHYQTLLRLVEGTVK